MALRHEPIDAAAEQMDVAIHSAQHWLGILSQPDAHGRGGILPWRQRVWPEAPYLE
jgi:hypothetical protein